MHALGTQTCGAMERHSIQPAQRPGTPGASPVRGVEKQTQRPVPSAQMQMAQASTVVEFLEVWQHQWWRHCSVCRAVGRLWLPVCSTSCLKAPTGSCQCGICRQLQTSAAALRGHTRWVRCMQRAACAARNRLPCCCARLPVQDTHAAQAQKQCAAVLPAGEHARLAADACPLVTPC